MKNVLEENKTLTQIVYDAGRPPAQQHAQPPERIHQSISRNVRRKIRLKSHFMNKNKKGNDCATI